MGGKRKILVALLAAGMLVALASGCGGDSNASDGSGASAEFRNPNTTEKIATFGKEADDAEREAASKVLEENLEARAAGDFKRQCATLSEKGVGIVRRGFAYLAEKACWKNLRGQAGETLSQTKEVRASTMTGPIDALRVEGNSGWALYHGTEGQDYAMPMDKEGGEWKVSRLTERALP